MDLTITGVFVLSVLGILGLVLILTSFVITQQKTSKILTMFGKYHSTTKAGLSTKIPWPFVIQRVTIPLYQQQLKGEVTVKVLRLPELGR